MKEATQLLTSGHFATSSIREKNSELQKCWMDPEELGSREKIHPERCLGSTEVLFSG
jgi:hypothetical protein